MGQTGEVIRFIGAHEHALRSGSKQGMKPKISSSLRDHEIFGKGYHEDLFSNLDFP
jgi:hypothetical protein